MPLKADYRPRSTSLAAKRPAEDVLQVALTEKVIEPVRTQSEATIKSPEKAQDEPRFTNKTMSFSELKELAETHTKLKEALHQQVRKETFPSTKFFEELCKATGCARKKYSLLTSHIKSCAWPILTIND